MTPTHENFEQRLAEALQQEASLTMTMTDTQRELRRWKDNLKHRRSTARIAAIAAAAAAVVGVILGVTLIGSGTHKTPPTRPANTRPSTSTFQAPPALPGSTATTIVRGAVNTGDYAFGAVWSTGFGPTANHLYRLDPTTGKVLTDSTFVGPNDGGVAPFRVGNVMLLPVQLKHGRGGYLVYRASGQATGRLIPASAPGTGSGDATGGWVPLGTHTVGRVDASGHLVRQLPVGNTTVTAVGSGTDALWVGRLGSTDVLRLDPDTGKVIARIPVGDNPVQILVTPTAVFASTGHYQIVRIDPATNRVTATATNGVEPRSWALMALGPDGNVWASPDEGGIVVLAAADLSVVKGMQVFPDARDGGVSGIAVTSQRVFLGDVDHGRMVSFPLS